MTWARLRGPDSCVAEDDYEVAVLLTATGALVGVTEVLASAEVWNYTSAGTTFAYHRVPYDIASTDVEPAPVAGVEVLARELVPTILVYMVDPESKGCRRRASNLAAAFAYKLRWGKITLGPVEPVGPAAQDVVVSPLLPGAPCTACGNSRTLIAQGEYRRPEWCLRCAEGRRRNASTCLVLGCHVLRDDVPEGMNRQRPMHVQGCPMCLRAGGPGAGT